MFGATITITSQYGNLLVAFLALYVGWTGSNLWGIICFGLHQLRSTDYHDGLHYQQQAVFRNTLPAHTVLWRLTRLGWTWRHNTKGAIRRTLQLLPIILAHMIAFISAAALSARVASAGANEALIKSNVCGWPDDHIISNFGNWTPEEIQIANNMFVSMHMSYREAAAHVRSCYTDDAPSSSVCESYVKRRIVSKLDTDFPCPFAEGACMTSAVRLDSRYLDSDLDLGITAARHNRVQLRKVTTCAPIPAEQKHSTGKITQFNPLQEVVGKPEYVRYYIGPSVKEKTEYTYAVSNYSIAYSSKPYIISSVYPLFYRPC
jgi:hypothetical protein